jgi:regulator of sirC expression with transglutaminase-like and TPR domain
MALNDYLFGELRFTGNERQYEDPRNSFLNQVLERRTGIPVTLALVYLEVARRAGLYVEGINFPGRFLLRCPARAACRIRRT